MNLRIISLVVLSLLFLGSSAIAFELSEKSKGVIKKEMVSDLKDSESARFKWMPMTKKEPEYYCGMINAKNSLGGYVGFAPYYIFLAWHKGEVVVAGLSAIVGQTDYLDEYIFEICTKNGYTNFYFAE